MDALTIQVAAPSIEIARFFWRASVPRCRGAPKEPVLDIDTMDGRVHDKRMHSKRFSPSTGASAGPPIGSRPISSSKTVSLSRQGVCHPHPRVGKLAEEGGTGVERRYQRRSREYVF